MADINVGQIAEALNEKMDRNLANTDAIGQAILDKKIEVEALLAQNGYAKFTWEEGNKISILFQWGLNSMTRMLIRRPCEVTHKENTMQNLRQGLR